MTREEADKVLDTGRRVIGFGDVPFRAIPYNCPGGYAVVLQVEDHPGLYFVLSEYGVDPEEDLRSMFPPPIVRLDLTQVPPTEIKETVMPPAFPPQNITFQEPSRVENVLVCPRCGRERELRAAMFYFRGQDFTGYVCASCNSLSENPDDSMMEAARRAGLVDD